MVLEGVVADSTATTWQSWLERHGPALLLYARQWCPCHAAEDAVQEGFLRFWKAGNATDHAIGYLYRCVKHAAIDQLRVDSRRRRRETEVGRDFPGQTAFEPDAAEQGAAVQQALAELPGGQREIVVMKIWGEMTFAAIAESLGISANTAASRYRYAMEKLQTRLAQDRCVRKA